MPLKDKVIIGTLVTSIVSVWFTAWVYLVTGLWLPVEMVKNIFN